jgi:hypothetical protein
LKYPVTASSLTPGGSGAAQAKVVAAAAQRRAS